MGEIKVEGKQALLKRRGISIAYTVQSSSNPDTTHLIVFITKDLEWICSCKGFTYQNKCWHIDEAKTLLPPMLQKYIKELNENGS